MKIFYLLFLCFSTVTFAQQTQDPWKGAEYAKNSESQKASAEDFLREVKFEGIESILDVGCGDGKITAAMARAIPKGSVIGVDISPSMIQVAKNSFSTYGNLHFFVEDAAKIQFENQFDLITSFTVMQWVLEQSKALSCFERALKPGGKVWIQIPTGLPIAMEKALEKTLAKKEWKKYYVDFAAPWKFYQKKEYEKLLVNAGLTPIRLDVVPKHEYFPSRAAFHGFLKQWFPYLRVLSLDLKETFLNDLLDQYLKILPEDSQGRVSFIVDRLEVEAVKSL